MELIIQCRCMGATGVNKCETNATQEDGLCDHCRLAHCEQVGLLTKEYHATIR